jgi:4-hydroxy-4-methyl-2-oxoglutarate aldolase
MHARVSAETLDALRLLDCCSVANAVEAFDVRLRNEGFSEPRLCCWFPKLPPMVGYATTLRVRASSPPSKGNTYLHRTDWWRHLEAVPGPRVMVIQDMDNHAGRGAFVGEVHANILKALGCVGVVTDGAVGDLAAIEELNLQLFSERVSVSHAYVHVVEFGTPVEVAGLQVRPGDLLHGDQNGLLRIPLEIAKDIPDIATDLREREKHIIAYSRSAEFSVAGLCALLEEGGAAKTLEPFLAEMFGLCRDFRSATLT